MTRRLWLSSIGAIGAHILERNNLFPTTTRTGVDPGRRSGGASAGSRDPAPPTVAATLPRNGTADAFRARRAAPFRGNDELLNFLPKGVIAFAGSGITDNPIDKAVKVGIPVQRVAA